MQQSLDNSVLSINLREYIHRIKPISLEKPRKTMSQDPCNQKEHKQLRALIGALAWPSNQCMPQLSASISLLQAHANSPTVGNIAEANKLLRFAKEIAKDYNMVIRRHCDLCYLRIGAYTDAAWAVRPDGSSQGGLLLFISSAEELATGAPMPLTVVQWHSKKLVRICRSSLSAEAQAAAMAADELEWFNIFMACIADPSLKTESEAALRKFGGALLVTDAKSLFDAAKSVTSGMKLSERRTAIELAIVRDRMKAMDGEWRWVNSHQQLADGLTKTQAKDALAFVLGRGTHRLVHDPHYTAAKKVSKEQREADEQELLAASNQIMNETYALEEKDETLCKLPGCGKKVDNSSEKNRYCSRRHFYMHTARTGDHQDAGREKALRGITALMILDQFREAEASDGQSHEGGDGWFWFFTLLVIFLTFYGLQNLIYKVYLLAEKFVDFLKKKNVLKSTEVSQNVYQTANDPVFEYNSASSSHGDDSSLCAAAAAVEHEMFLNQITLEVGEDTLSEQEKRDLGALISIQEYDRWCRLKREVDDEPGQHEWRQVRAALDDDNSNIDPFTRKNITQQGYTMRRWSSFAEILNTRLAESFTDEQIRHWHRHWNNNLVYLVNMSAKVNRELIENQNLRDRKNFAERVRLGQVEDKVIQTEQSFARKRSEPRYVILGEGKHGAWGHHNDFRPY